MSLLWHDHKPLLVVAALLLFYVCMRLTDRKRPK